MTWIGRHRWVILTLLAGFGLRVYFIRCQPHIAGDSLVYGDLATNMVRHHVFGLTEGGLIRPTLIRLPGYPLFVAACFLLFGQGNFPAVLAAQLVMDLAACCLLAALARRLWGQRAGMVALGLGALCPFTANYVASPLTETPAIFCAALSLYSLDRWRYARGAGTRGFGWAWTMGLALSFSILLRPDRALLALAIAGGMLWVSLAGDPAQRRPGFVHILLVCLVVAAPLFGWGVRNWRVFHVIQPLAPRTATDPGELVNPGFQRWYRTWAVDFKSTSDVYWNYDGSPLSLEDLPPRAFDTPEQRSETAALFTAYNVKTTATAELDKRFLALADQRVHAHPMRYYMALPTARLANMWLRPRTEMLPLALDWWNFRAHVRDSLVSSSLALFNLAYLVLACAGLRKITSGPRSETLVLVVSLASFILLRSLLLLTMDNSEPRYTMDCFPALILLAAAWFGPPR